MSPIRQGFLQDYEPESEIASILVLQLSSAALSACLAQSSHVHVFLLAETTRAEGSPTCARFGLLRAARACYRLLRVLPRRRRCAQAPACYVGPIERFHRLAQEGTSERANADGASSLIGMNLRRNERFRTRECLFLRFLGELKD